MILYKDNHTLVIQSSLFQTNSTVIETEDFILAADPCWLPEEVEYIRRYIDERKGDKPFYLLFTHSDYDHIIGYKAFPGAKVIGTANMIGNSKKEAILEQIREFDDSYYLKRNYEITYPEIDYKVEKNKQTLKLGKYTFTFYMANGHTNDGIFTLIEPLGIWIAGDYLSDIEFPYIYSNSRDYEKTLEITEEIVKQHRIKLLIPGHGSVTGDSEEIEKRIRDSKEYISKTRQLMTENKELETYSVLNHYSFPRIMKKFHEGNVNLLKKEMGI